MNWLSSNLDKDLVCSREERAFRFLEEALELFQAFGGSRAEAKRMVEFVYSKQVGKIEQEVGGSMLSLLALCWVGDIDLERAASAEIERIKSPEVLEQLSYKMEQKAKANVSSYKSH